MNSIADRVDSIIIIKIGFPKTKLCFKQLRVIAIFTMSKNRTNAIEN
jgi:hypothetical protein